ncbi:hypothetical protein [Motilibacter deserti]|uniref:Secreted protein n=1 Tax=Motilibacter deserti TaxID=2714956 RepID=A0ABX0GTR5_9ACTN|nr:hypothetical protein [Motilibacter deserti]NHC13055.1 hypothetical protein [Motilibacter deserti]
MKPSTTRRLTLLLVTTAAAALPLGAPTAAQASGKGDDEIRKSGSCSSGGRWELKAKTDDGGLEVEFEVDTNRAGQTWSVRVTDNGAQVFRGSRTTRPPSGSFSVERHITDRSGTDTIVATATRSGTSQRCTGRLSI